MLVIDQTSKQTLARTELPYLNRLFRGCQDAERSVVEAGTGDCEIVRDSLGLAAILIKRDEPLPPC